jgi:tetratricopeptide (TPR) repeat protein
MQETPTEVDPQAALASLEARLKETPRAARPLEHAALSYSVGLAYAELPTGDRERNLSRAVASYHRAAEIFWPDRFPVEHARVQNALGSALRDLGRHREAEAAFTRATELLAPGLAPAELGAALNNLGLVRSELGDHQRAIAALRQSVQLFETAREPRQVVMARHNLGQATAAAGDHAAAVQTYDVGIGEADPELVPYQWAMLHHSKGVSLTALGDGPAAADAFTNALRVFTRQRYPFQYALAKNNLGLACAQIGGSTPLRRAVAAYEDALRVLDPRVHRAQWEQAYRNMELAETGLREEGLGMTRTQHFAALVADVEGEARIMLLRERLTEILELPEPRRTESLAELDLVALRLPDSQMRSFTAAWLHVLMELPNDMLLAGLRARLAAHGQIASDEDRALAEEALEDTIQGELLAPQRIRVRDTLTAMGYERR